MLVRVRIGDEEVHLAWEEWEERVRAGRVPPTALVHFDAVTGGEWRPAADLEMYRSLANEATLAWQSRFTSSPPPLVTALLVGLQIRVWWLARLPEVAAWLVLHATNWTPPALEDGETWRLLVMGGVQVDTPHLVLNMLWLAYTGWNVERALGRSNLAVLYGASVLGGSLLSMFATPDTPSLGASGGVFGLIAASVVFGATKPELLPERGRRLFGLAMLPYLVVMLVSGFTNESTDNWSHLGGLLTGGALAFLLDPDTLQRRAGWNRWVHAAVITAALGILVPMGLFGPRLHPLVDSEAVDTRRRARVAASLEPPPPSYRTVEHAVPAGWTRGSTSARDPGWISPHAGRAWSVREVGGEEQLQGPGLVADWLARLRRSWPEAEVVAGPEPASLAGIPGVALEVRVRDLAPGKAPHTLEAWAAARGTTGLVVVWEVEERRRERLEPLHLRLEEAVVWNEPMALIRARADVERNPASARNRTEYAAELAKVGRGAEALALWDALVAERPADESLRLSQLDTATWAVGDAGELESRLAEALVAQPTPRVALAVARHLEESGRGDEAAALIDLAWIRNPGDRTLRRARVDRGLSTALDRTEVAIWTTDLVTGAPVEPPADRPPLTLEAAGRWSIARGEARMALARHVVSLLEAGDPRALDALARLRESGPPADRGRAAVGLARDLVAHLAGRPVEWIPAGITLRGEVVEQLASGTLAPCEEGDGWCPESTPE